MGRRSSAVHLSQANRQPLRLPHTSPLQGEAVPSLRPIAAGPDAVVIAAPAKLNLFLEILGKRPDGYHELETLMLGIDLFDTLEVKSIPEPQLRLECEPVSLSNGPDNLVIKAAEALRRQVNRPDLGASIRLTKRIPTQAGLAGGSSDAAATLVALNHLWKLNLPKADLALAAAAVGSDVAFFLDLPAGWCTGRGEIVQPEPLARRLHFVIVCPPIGLGTADVYRRLTVPASPLSGEAVRQALRNGDLEALGRALHNRLQEPAFALSPPVQDLVRQLTDLRPAGGLMSGSGSACFALCRDRDDAQRVAAAIRVRLSQGAFSSTRVLVVQSLAHDDAS